MKKFLSAVMFFIFGFAVGAGVFCGLTFYLLNGSSTDFKVLLDFLIWW